MPNKKYHKAPGKATPGDAWAKKELFLFEPRTLLIIIITSVLTLLVAFFGDKGAKFLSSVISPVPNHTPYDGVTFPIKQVPNWVKLTEQERNAPYSQIPQDKFTPLPPYNPARLAIPTASLKWNDPKDDTIRIEKITYTTPYLGSYRLDGVEGSGSHPAVDIKVPHGTPVHAMGNGTVIKAEYSSGGFGTHIVIQHNDFPSFDDPTKKVTLFSSYSHLSLISVQVNQVVQKGEIIALSGSSGTASTPHLHFQIDTDQVKWHPYWPFTGADMRNAGYSFFQAINNGLGQNQAALYTLNSMRYVHKYFGQQMLVASAQPVVTQALAHSDRYSGTHFVIQVSQGSQFNEGSDISFIIQAFDEQGNLLTDPDFKDEVQLSLLNDIGRLNRKTLSSKMFMSGIANVVKVLDAKSGTDKLIVRFRDKEFSSVEFKVIQKKAVLGGFFVEPERSTMVIGETIKIKLRAADVMGTYIRLFDFEEMPTVTLTNPRGQLSHSRLVDKDIVDGQATIIFTAETPGETEILVGYKSIITRSPVITIRQQPSVTSVIVPPATVPLPVPPPPPPPPPLPPSPPPLQPQTTVPTHLPVAVITMPAGSEVAPSTQSTPDTAEQRPFSDISESNRYYTALNDLKSAGIVAGYGDKSFKPEKDVSRAEAIAFILKAIDEKVRNNLVAIFPDVVKEAWYVNFVATAYDLGFVKGYPDGTFKPESTVTLAEFFTMFFVAAKTDIDPHIIASLPPGIAPTDWYAPYLQEALKKGILDISTGQVNPAKPLTRGDVVEILYKVRKVEKEA